MSIMNFIPTIWSETLLQELDKNYVGIKLSTREYEGAIKKQGDRVKINSIGPISVFNYQPNNDMPLPQALSDDTTELIIDQAKGFNFFVDSIDDVQSSPKLIQGAMKNAADALSDYADRYIYSLYDSRVPVVEAFEPTIEDITKYVTMVRRRLMENNVPNSAKLSLEVPPVVEQMLLLSNLLTDTDNSGVLTKGYIGKMLGFDIYVTNNIIKTDEGKYRCFARTENAIAFAEQINSIKPYEPERRNGTAVKGLHLYGAQIIHPSEMVYFDVTPDSTYE